MKKLSLILTSALFLGALDSSATVAPAQIRSMEAVAKKLGQEGLPADVKEALETSLKITGKSKAVVNFMKLKAAYAATFDKAMDALRLAAGAEEAAVATPRSSLSEGDNAGKSGLRAPYAQPELGDTDRLPGRHRLPAPRHETRDEFMGRPWDADTQVERKESADFRGNNPVTAKWMDLPSGKGRRASLPAAAPSNTLQGPTDSKLCESFSLSSEDAGQFLKEGVTKEQWSWCMDADSATKLSACFYNTHVTPGEKSNFDSLVKNLGNPSSKSGLTEGSQGVSSEGGASLHMRLARAFDDWAALGRPSCNMGTKSRAFLPHHKRTYAHTFPQHRKAAQAAASATSSQRRESQESIARTE